MTVTRRRLPCYIDRIPLARRRKPDTWLVVGIETSLVLSAVVLALFVYYRSHDLPFYATKAYAYLGSSEAQHVLSEYYLSRRHEDPKHTGLAEHWLTRAAGNGHSLAAYNLAVAHLRGDLTNQNERTPEKTEPPTREVVHGLLSQAVKGGVHEALSLLHLCGHGQCSKRQKRSSSNTKGQ